MDSLKQVRIGGARLADQPLMVNRAVIRLGQTRQLVYYFFKQRDRVLTNEYAVKWFLMWDALMRNRTDGALVRATTLVTSDESLESADRRLQTFVAGVASELGPFVPD